MKNLVLTLFTILLCYGNVWTQCPTPASNIIFFQTQQDIDDFASLYPNCTLLNASLTISGTPQNGINDLTPLSQLESIEGRLSIINTSLTTLAGLDNLESIGDFLSITNNDNLTNLTGLGSLKVMSGNFLITGNDGLNTLAGLEALNSIGGLQVSSNSSLTALSGLDELFNLNGNLVLSNNGSLNDLTALSNTNAVGSELQIINEPSLTNLGGLQNLSSIGGSLFMGSTGLVNLSALENLTTIGGELRLSDNNNLTGLTGLENINHTTITNLNITNNPNLSICGVKSVCDYLAADLSATIQGNATGCTDENVECVDPLINLSVCDTIDSEGFEEGWGIWIDGGSDAARVNKPYYASSGTYSINIQDNSSQSVITTQNLDLAQYPFISVDFSFYAVSMDTNESFLLEISTNGGQNFDAIEEFTVGDDFENNTNYTISVPINQSLTSQTQIRFRCNASSNTDDVYLDDIVITACITGCNNQGQACDDGDPCTAGETYDQNCNCTGGIFQDEDGDSVCDNDDICPDFNNNLIGTPCDDGEICTINDFYDGDCDCRGTYVGDSDGDGLCDTEDPCPDQAENACTEYCEAEGTNTTYEYIQSVELGVENDTGNDHGYGDYTYLPGILIGGYDVPIILTPGFTEGAYDEHWGVWIDLNKDGDFDDNGEEVFSGTSHGTQALTGIIHVPASFGLTRMRVAMRWKKDPHPCGQFLYGEVEDYIVDLGPLPQGKTTTANNLIQTYPNPASDFVNVDIHDIILDSNVQSVTAMIYTMNGQQVHSEEMQPTTTLTINTQRLPEASYILRLRTDDGRTFTGKFVKL